MLNDIENVYFIDIGFDSYHTDQPRVINFSMMRCIDFGGNSMPTKYQIYMDTPETILPDVVVRNQLDMRKYAETKVPVTEGKLLIQDFVRSRDLFASVHSPDVIKSLLGKSGLGVEAFDDSSYIDITYFMTRHVEIKTDRWTPQGYKIPPTGDYSFLDTCFYGIVPEEKWSLRTDDIDSSLERARKGAILTYELARFYNIDQMLLETQKREKELKENVCNLY